MCYAHQVSHIVMKSTADESNSKTSFNGDDIGNIVFFEFTNPSNELETIFFTFHMTNAVK